ncbi:hypothetical protein DPMN_008589 [Dreissena polymorpha]|uniref:Uncharacterized protein n=1 Tax=Dreissena polymorpha TaxID=45954 RepID=A0A9D4MZ21_DREPO|nr:hypothetical protein DPMN_008589 [Dreissena polymorpha]
MIPAIDNVKKDFWRSTKNKNRGVVMAYLLIVIEPPAVKVCKAWCHRLEGLVKKREFLEETMAWLSTLGGGYSSLGDYFRHFSVRAGEISIQQFRIALEMGDPVMVSKCRLFYAQSLMQLGPLRMSKLMIRQEFHTARYVLKDQKLVDMCKGMWSKLQFCYAKKRVKPTSSSDVHNGVTLAR